MSLSDHGSYEVRISPGLEIGTGLYFPDTVFLCTLHALEPANLLASVPSSKSMSFLQRQDSPPFQSPHDLSTWSHFTFIQAPPRSHPRTPMAMSFFLRLQIQVTPGATYPSSLRGCVSSHSSVAVLFLGSRCSQQGKTRLQNPA